MEESIITTIVSAISPSALPLVVVVVAVVYFYFKFKGLEKDRESTKELRDNDSQTLHDKVLKHDFQITQLRDNQSLNATAVDDLRDQVSLLNTNIVKLTVIVEHLSDAIKEIKHEDKR